MSVISFRGIEAMYKTSPDVVESSIWNYIGYYGNIVSTSTTNKAHTQAAHPKEKQMTHHSIVRTFDPLTFKNLTTKIRLWMKIPYVWNPKTNGREKITATKLIRSFTERLWGFAVLSLVLSLLIHFEYKPFDDRVDLTSFKFSRDLFSFGHLCNSYCLTGKTTYHSHIFRLNNVARDRFLTDIWLPDLYQCSSIVLHVESHVWIERVCGKYKGVWYRTNIWLPPDKKQYSNRFLDRTLEPHDTSSS